MEGLRKVSAPIYSILLLLLFVISCSATSSNVQNKPGKGIYHLVKKGETFRIIARAYRVKMQDLAEINNIQNHGLIEEGSVIFIQEASEIVDDVLAVSKKMDGEKKNGTGVSIAAKTKSSPDNNTGKKLTSPDNSKPAPKNVKIINSMPVQSELNAGSTQGQIKTGEKKGKQSKAKSTVKEKDDTHLEKKRFIWPVQGSVKSNFGIQPGTGKTYHNWIKIVSTPGTPVKAADDGTIIFSTLLKDYGKTIIVRHQNGYATVYTHLKKILVKTRQKIKKGNIIALIGEIDEEGDTFMNFEVRLNGKARNPIFFLISPS
jgi:murein DD-endopeptidase MepM/ murein hydrolase activator NlpD